MYIPLSSLLMKTHLLGSPLPKPHAAIPEGIFLSPCFLVWKITFPVNPSPIVPFNNYNHSENPLPLKISEGLS